MAPQSNIICDKMKTPKWMKGYKSASLGAIFKHYIVSMP